MLDQTEKLQTAIEALRVIAYPRRGTPEETMDIVQLGAIAAKALTEIGYERD
jgi:hypothetical protein